MSDAATTERYGTTDRTAMNDSRTNRSLLLITPCPQPLRRAVFCCFGQKSFVRRMVCEDACRQRSANLVECSYDTGV